MAEIKQENKTESINQESNQWNESNSNHQNEADINNKSDSTCTTQNEEIPTITDNFTINNNEETELKSVEKYHRSSSSQHRSSRHRSGDREHSSRSSRSSRHRSSRHHHRDRDRFSIFCISSLHSKLSLFSIPSFIP